MVRRRRSEAWEREGSKRERGIAFWGFCRARALARRVRRALPGAVHGDGEVAAAWAALEAAGRVARLGRLQREARGRWRRSSAMRGHQREARGAGLALHGGQAALHCTAVARQSRELEEGDKGCFAISKTSKDHSVNKQ